MPNVATPGEGSGTGVAEAGTKSTRVLPTCERDAVPEKVPERLNWLGENPVIPPDAVRSVRE
jgi:hypothetical protein